MLCIYEQLFLRLLLSRYIPEVLMPVVVGPIRSSWWHQRRCDGIDACQQRFISAIKVYPIMAGHLLSNKVIEQYKLSHCL